MRRLAYLSLMFVLPVIGGCYHRIVAPDLPRNESDAAAFRSEMLVDTPTADTPTPAAAEPSSDDESSSAP